MNDDEMVKLANRVARVLIDLNCTSSSIVRSDLTVHVRREDGSISKLSGSLDDVNMSHLEVGYGGV
jgi:16S rRNA C967 or C1407 C5-methylase (RsmB/RsmF family)